MILCVAPSPAVDKLFEVARLRRGEIHRPTLFQVLPGGKGVHVASTLASIGGDPVLTGVLGGHAGRWLSDQLAAAGIDGHFAWTDAETRVCLSVADSSTGELTEFYESAAAVPPKVWDDLLAIVAAALPATTWLVIAGSLPEGFPVEGNARLIEAAIEEDVPSALDSHGAPLAAALLAGPQLVKINGSEAGELLGVLIEDLSDACRAARSVWLQAGGTGHLVAITVSEGVALIDRDGLRWEARVPVDGPYPVGCGDCFLGGMVYGLAAGRSAPQSIPLAVGVAAANAEVPGAGRFSLARARQLARLVEVVRT